MRIMVDTVEAATILSVSESLLNHMRQEGSKRQVGVVDGPPFIRVGRKVLYRVADLESWAAAQVTFSPPPRRGRPTRAEQIARRQAA